MGTGTELRPTVQRIVEITVEQYLVVEVGCGFKNLNRVQLAEYNEMGNRIWCGGYKN